jgi:hypothetical protein
MIRKITGNADEVIFRTDDGGFVWKRYVRGELDKKQKYLFYTLRQVRAMHPGAMYIRDMPVLSR